MRHRLVARYALYGALLGFSLHNIGFASYGELHAMFVFDDFRMFLCFAGAVAMIAVGYLVLARGVVFPPRPIHKGTIPGSLLFGAGWVLTGACPGIIMVQLGAGYAPAFLTLVGALFGTWLYNALSGKLFRWSTGSCEL